MKKILILLMVLAVIGFSACEKDPDDDGNGNGDGVPGPVGFTELDISQSGFDLVYGGAGNNDDELIGGMVADASGNVYVSMNIIGANARRDVILIKVNADGTLGWSKRYDAGKNDWQPDSGENAETGGTAGSISIDSDGFVYLIMTTTQANMSLSSLVMKVSPVGSIVWQKMWKEAWPTGSPLGWHGNDGYAIDATGDYVYFTGATGTNKVIVCALNKSDGSIFFQAALNVVPGTKDRGYAIKPDNTGNLYVGGVSGSTGFFAKISSANTPEPQLEWVKNAGLSFAARVNCIDVDNTGVYFSCDIRGATTRFQVMKTDFDGNSVWSVSFPGIGNDRNNTHVVKVIGDYVYAGGRIAFSELDDLSGDGLIAKLSKSDGSLVWHGIYHGGKDRTLQSEHRVKGVAVVGNDLIVAGQVYGSSMNFENFDGKWYKKNEISMQSASVSISNISTSEFELLPDGEVRDGEGSLINDTGTLQNSSDKTIDTPPDADAFIIKVRL